MRVCCVHFRADMAVGDVLQLTDLWVERFRDQLKASTRYQSSIRRLFRLRGGDSGSDNSSNNTSGQPWTDETLRAEAARLRNSADGSGNGVQRRVAELIEWSCSPS